MKQIHTSYLLFIILVFSGCFEKRNLLKTNPYENIIKIKGNVGQISISDLRQNISKRQIKIPAITFPGMKDEISPELQESTGKLIKGEVSKQFSANSDITYDIEVKIIKGVIGFKALALSEKEFTDIIIEILATDQDKNTREFSAKVYLEVKSSDASPKYLHLLFERGLINTISKCFKKNDN